ncbi:MAG: HlyD family secretion protein, partial [Candidatus Rokuibacteriota bacterium]
MMRLSPAPALLAVVLLLAACQDVPATAAQERGKGAAAQPSREVRVIAAATEMRPRTVTATGTLAADELVVLGTKVPGRLAEITVDLGSRVRRGQRIARLDESDFRMRVDQADAALQQARARLGLSPRGTDETVNPERTAIVRQARAVLDEAKLTRDRSEKLVQQELIARAQFDTAVANLAVAEGRYQDAREEVRHREAVIAQRRAELDLARQQLADTAIVSPIDGAVS